MSQDVVVDPKKEEEQAPEAAVQLAEASVGPKQGSKCCGCLCDYRRALILVALIFIILHIIVVILVPAGAAYSDKIGTVDSADEDAWEEHVEDEYETTQIILSALWVVFGIGAIVGAVKYNVWLVGLYVVFLVVCAITDITSMVLTCNDFKDQGHPCDVSGEFIFVELLFVSLNIYPSIGYIVEVHKGILSKATYPREEYSCCCV